MSSAGQAVGGIVGAVAGFFVGGPTGAMYGAQIGMMAGSLIDPPKGPHVKGPRLDDLSVQTSTYGAVIPRVYGTVALSGNVFWLENNRLLEVPKETESGGGKGGGSSTTTTSYAYYATFAVGLCEGPIFGVRRIWVGSKLIYDAGSSDQGTVRASNRASELFTLHTGEETQLPDDRMEATLGVGNTPAYRGLAYLVLKDYPLADNGNSLMAAPVKVEVVQSGRIDRYVATLQPGGPAGIYSSIAWNGQVFCAILGTSSDSVATSFDGVNWEMTSLPLVTYWKNVVWNGEFFCIVSGAGAVALSSNGKHWSLSYIAVTAPSFLPLAWGNGVFCTMGALTNKCAASKDGVLWASSLLPSASRYWYDICYGNGVFCAVSSNSICAISTDGLNWTEYPMPTAASRHMIAWNGSVFCVVVELSAVGATSPDGINWTTHAMPSSQHWRCIIWNGSVFLATMNSGGNHFATSADGIVWEYWAMGFGDINATAWNGAVFVGVGNNATWTILPEALSSVPPTLSTIASAEMLNSNLLDASDIDSASLTQTVRGYTVASVAAIRAALDPLQAAWPFDVIQSGYKIKFVPRGGASVATIQAADLDARGAGDSPGVSITNVREMDSILPRRVSLSYADVDREYDVGEQYAERLNTDSVNVRSTELAIVMRSGEAAVAAEVLLYLAWLERHDLTFPLPPTYSRLEPSDVITVNASEASYEVRLTAITYEQDGRLSCSAKYNAAATYTSTAVGEYGTAVGNGITDRGQTAFAVLDIPDLRDSTGNTGFVVAMAGYLKKWPGGVLYRSDDGGSTWSNRALIMAPGATMGYAANPIGAGRIGLIDSASVLVVWLISGELSSVGLMAMMGRANNFAYGAPGRWEIIGAMNCVQQVDGTYFLTDLLRGRKGTEWACGLHEAQDAVILLDSTLAFDSLDLSAMLYSYRAVTLGDAITTGSARSLTYKGVALECYSPVHLNGNRDPASNDWTLMWVSRTRTFGEWRDAVDAPSAEMSQDFQIEIYATAAYATLKRTIKVINTDQATYTSAQQIVDFGSNQATLYVMVYQLSPTVGPGQPLITSITR